MTERMTDERLAEIEIDDGYPPVDTAILASLDRKDGEEG